MAQMIRTQIKQLVDSQRELKAVFNTVGDALITFDTNQNIKTANIQVKALSGRSQSELIGKSVSILLKQSDDYISISGPEILGKYMESLALRSNGETIPVEAVVTQTELSNHILYIASIRDISERKNAQQRINEFYAIAAHELRSPFTAIHGSLLLLQGGLGGTLNEKGLRLVCSSIESSERLGRLINDYLDLEKIASGNFDNKKTQSSLYELASKAIEGIEGMATSSDVKLELIGAPELKVECDRDGIIRVLTNLLSNAIKFSPKSSTVKVSVESLDASGKARCSVADEGPGISLSDMPNLFGKFQQMDSAKDVKSKGTGLGLAISKALVEAAGGTIGVDVGSSKGTVFWFELPVID